MTENPFDLNKPFDFNKWIRDAMQKAKEDQAKKPESLPDFLQPNKPFERPEYRDPFADLIASRKPTEDPDKDTGAGSPAWWEEFLGTPKAGSPVAPAELPAEQRAACAQMYAQYAEFQRVGFTREEAWKMIFNGWLTVVAIQAKHQLGGS